MTNTYKIQIDLGNGAPPQTRTLVPNPSENKARPMRLLAQKGARYELQQTRETTKTPVGLDQVHVQRIGQDLQVWFEPTAQPSLVLEGYYSDPARLPQLVGSAENGRVYEYIPQAPDLKSMTSQLSSGQGPVAMALGGPALPMNFLSASAAVPSEVAAVSSSPAASATPVSGGISVNPWLLAGAAALGLGGGGGGGGGGGDTSTVVPPTVLQAASHSLTFTEDQTTLTTSLNLLSNAVPGTGKTLANLSVSQAKEATGTSQTITQSASVTLQGTYGSLLVQADGTSTYTLDNSNTKVQALKQGDVVKDKFLYTLTDGSGNVSEASIDVTVNGINDVPTFTPAVIGNVLQWATVGSGVTRTLTVSDRDEAESGLGNMLISSTTQKEYAHFDGVFGTLDITQTATGQYSLSWLCNKVPIGDATEHDLFTLVSKDGTAYQTLDFAVARLSDTSTTKQRYYTQSTEGLTLNGGGSARDDTLCLVGNAAFDITAANVTLKDVDNIELLNGTSSATEQTLKLNLQAIVQANSIHRLTVNGGAEDTVTFVGATAVQPTTDAAYPDYKIYTFNNLQDPTGTYQLWVNQAVAVTFIA